MATNSTRDQFSVAGGYSAGVAGFHLLTIATLLALTSCVSPAPRTVSVATPPPVIEVYFYPKKGQTEAQQKRDRYECYLWAKKQTGFDPSSAQLLPHQQKIIIEPAPPSGAGAAVGAITGAVIGSAVSGRRSKPEGAVLGAIAGAIIGATSEEAARSEQARQQAEQIEAQQVSHIEQQASNYRRAMTACLEGRGYEVR